VPEFLRGCIAVCCLEQGFPIEFHAPVTPREVLLCGTCLIASTELIRKLPCHERLPHGYGCVAIENVNDIGTLSESLAAVVRDPAVATAIGARGRRFAFELQRYMPFPAARWLNGRNMFAPKTSNGSQDRRPRSRPKTSRISEGEKHVRAKFARGAPSAAYPLIACVLDANGDTHAKHVSRNTTAVHPQKYNWHKAEYGTWSGFATDPNNLTRSGDYDSDNFVCS
jgi:hypothetical protein